jgi:hypothetical protein
MMNKIFHNLILDSVVCIYLDDILIFTKSKEEHDHITHMVLECLWQHKLYLCFDKCKFAKTCIEYLGVIISQNHVKMDLVQIAGMAEWPTPKSKKEVQLFVSFINFTDILLLISCSMLIHYLTSPRRMSCLSGVLPKISLFKELKHMVMSTPVLVMLHSKQPYCVEADGSGVTTGAVLLQLNCEDEKWHLVAFQSKSLSVVERNYEIHDIEMLAII